MSRSWAADTLDITVPVTFEAGAAITSLTGGTVVAHAARAGVAVVEGVATIESANAVRVLFAAGTLSAGVWQLQVRVMVSGVVQTIVDTVITIRESI
jgi:soluble lytic murein transglycosylase-like protein